MRAATQDSIMAAIRPRLHILFFVVVNWAASKIVCILQPSIDVVMLLLCFRLELILNHWVNLIAFMEDNDGGVFTFVYYWPHVKDRTLGHQWFARRARYIL